MDAVIACPRCQRELQRPHASAGDTARCRACEATFGVPVSDALCGVGGSGATSVSFRTFLSQDRGLSEPEQRLPTDGVSNPFRGGWRKGRVALVGIMAALVLDLVVLALNLTVWGIGIMEPDPDALCYLWDDWGRPLSSAGLYFLVAAGFCMAAACAFALSYENLQARGAFATGGAVLLMVGLLRLLCGLAFVWRDSGAGGFSDLGPESLWPVWLFWTGLFARWSVELLVLLFLAALAWDWQHKETLSHLRWVGCWLVVEVLAQMAALTGALAECHSFLVSQHRLDAVSAGAIICAPMLVVRLAVTAQLFQALLAARRALADPSDVRQPAPDA
jgi:hypothetical protein